MKIGIIGCGHMGSAIMRALISKKAGSVWISNPTKPHIHLDFKWTIDNRQVVKNTDILFIAVKPGVVSTVLREIKGFLKKDQIIISIAAGIPLQKLSLWTDGHKKTIRVMPNLPAQIFEGSSVWKSSPGITQKDKRIIKNLLGSFGKAFEVHSENLIDIATAASGGAPAYTAAFLETIASTLKKHGMNKKDARALAIQAALGSVLYIAKTGVDFSDIKNAVQTKGGTTEAGFKLLEKKNWQKIFENALIKGYERAKEISRS